MSTLNGPLVSLVLTVAHVITDPCSRMLEVPLRPDGAS